jgi:hypothetical protein
MPPLQNTTCPSCGVTLSPNAKACPKCGAKKKTHSWEQDDSYDGLDFSGTPEDDFDYNEFIQSEFGSDPKGRKKFTPPGGLHLFWWIVAIIALLAFALAFIL